MKCRVALLVSLLAVAPMVQAQMLTKEKTEAIDAATVYIVVLSQGRGSSGSGFVVKTDGDDTYIVTNDHVINPEHAAMARGAEASGKAKPDINVIFNSGLGPMKEKRAKGTVVAADPDRDLAVVKVSKVANPPAPIIYKDSPKPDKLMPVVVFGFPEGGQNALDGQNPTCTTVPTTISNLQPNKLGQVGRIQFNGGATHGSSGGPVVAAADGKLIGVTSSGFDGTSIAFAIPRDEVAAVLAGTAGRVRMTAKDDTTAVLKVNILNPLKTVKRVTAHYRDTAVGVTAKNGIPEIMADAKKVDLALENSTASGEIMAKDKAFVQIELEIDGGKVVTMPAQVNARTVTAGATPNPEMIRPAAGGKPRMRTPEGRVVELPGIPLREKPKSSPGATDLSELNRRPDSFLDKSLSIEGLSSCQLTPAEEGFYELTVLTEAGNAPSNLKVLLPKDLALQVSEVYVTELADFGYALKLDGKVRKPARGDIHVFEASEVHFLNEEAKPMTSLKTLAAAPPGPATLSLVNRFPGDFKGKTVTLDAFVAGVDNISRETALRIHHPANTPVLNLRFYAAKDLASQVESDVPRDGAPAKVTCVVEAIDNRKGHGILGVTSIDILDSTGTPKKTISSKDKITYPTMLPPKSASSTGPSRTSSPGAVGMAAPPTESKKTPAVNEAHAAKTDLATTTSESGNMMLFLGIGGGVGTLAIALGAFLLLRGGKKAGPPASKYQRKAEPVSTPQPKPQATAKPKTAPKTKAAPKSDDNPFANFQ